MSRGDGGGGTVGTRGAAGAGERRTRRVFSPEHKLRVLAAYDEASARGDGVAVLRREGLTKAQVAEWDRARRDGALGALGGLRRGPRGEGRDVEVERLRADKARLEAELDRARLVIEVQGKVSALLETASGSAHGSSTGPTSRRASRRPATPPS